MNTLTIISPGETMNFDYAARTDPPTPAYRCRATHISGKRYITDENSTAYLYTADPAGMWYTVGNNPVANHLAPGCWACVPGSTLVAGIGLIIESLDFIGIRQTGGPIEAKGRLRYIDGCSDSILVPPPRIGDPCLNHLHFPKHISQTMHTHPSVRIGMVARGRGRCVTPAGELPLTPGLVWALPVDDQHCFFTDDSTMDIIAWHPDTDTGPSDENHPMVNRTLVEGHTVAGNAAIATTGTIREE